MLLFTNHVFQALDEQVARLNPASVVVLTDSNTVECVLPQLQSQSEAVAAARVITVAPGDANKNIDTVNHIWKELSSCGATRNTLLLNVGGGVVTDMGGFAAATFKRGIRFINLPTTLLAAVDASVGGKNGINFNGLKNEIGTFREPEATIISTEFFRTLTSAQLLEGYAEMLKHALISSEEMTSRLLAYDITEYRDDTLLDLLRESVAVKEKYVPADPLDTGARHALNFGHTFAHAFESLAMQRQSPLSHGYAVAFGMVAAMILSHLELKCPTDWLNRYAAYVKARYGTFAFTCKDVPVLIDFMRHDKKNEAIGAISFVLLEKPGVPVINHPVADANIPAALDLYLDMMA